MDNNAREVIEPKFKKIIWWIETWYIRSNVLLTVFDFLYCCSNSLVETSFYGCIQERRRCFAWVSESDNWSATPIAEQNFCTLWLLCISIVNSKEEEDGYDRQSVIAEKHWRNVSFPIPIHFSTISRHFIAKADGSWDLQAAYIVRTSLTR